jgi:hypothetical protein
MAAETNRAPLSVYMLADHLDGALAAGEDLIRRGGDWRQWAEKGVTTTARDLLVQRKILEDVRGFELILTAHILKARDHAATLAKIDKRFGPVATAFAAGTAQLLDAAEEAGDATMIDFETGDSVLAYVRSRGLIAPHAANITSAAHLTIDDQFLIARRIALGPLLDMAATFLDALDIHYELFAEEDGEPAVDALDDGSSEADAALPASH